MNSIFVTFCDKLFDTWMFDDVERSLKREPFVMGASEAIDYVVSNDEASTCRIIHAAEPFPGHTHIAERLDKEYGGYWYTLTDNEGEWCCQDDFWLCPATTLFYGDHPEQIYVNAERV